MVSEIRSDKTQVRITVKFKKIIGPDDAEHLSLMNMIMRRCLGMLNLTEIKRDYYDSEAAQRIQVCKKSIFDILLLENLEEILKSQLSFSLNSFIDTLVAQVVRMAGIFDDHQLLPRKFDVVRRHYFESDARGDRARCFNETEKPARFHSKYQLDINSSQIVVQRRKHASF